MHRSKPRVMVNVFFASGLSAFRIFAGIATRPLLSTEYSACPLKLAIKPKQQWLPGLASAGGELRPAPLIFHGSVWESSPLFPTRPQTTVFLANVKGRRRKN